MAAMPAMKRTRWKPMYCQQMVTKMAAREGDGSQMEEDVADSQWMTTVCPCPGSSRWQSLVASPSTGA